MKSAQVLVCFCCIVIVIFGAASVTTQSPRYDEVQHLVVEEPPTTPVVEGLRGLKEVCINNVIYYKYRDNISPKIISKPMSSKTFLEKC